MALNLLENKHKYIHKQGSYFFGVVIVIRKKKGATKSSKLKNDI